MENEVIVISAIEVKKDLYKSKVNAKFSHFDDSKMFYTVEIESGKYVFPISVVKKRTIKIIEDDEIIATIETEKAAPDLKGAIFGTEIKASELNRWIEKAIANNEFTKIG